MTDNKHSEISGPRSAEPVTHETQHKIQDRVFSATQILETTNLPDGHPDLPMILGVATVLDERLSELTGTVTDEQSESYETAAQFSEAMDDLMTAVDLCKTLRVFCGETHDDDGMTAGTVVQQIEKSVRAASDRIGEANMAHRRLAEKVADNMLRIEGEGEARASTEPDGQEALDALGELMDRDGEVRLLIDNFPDGEWKKGTTVNREVVSRLYAASALTTRIHTIVEQASDLQAASEGDPAETYDSLKETVAGNIRMLAAEHDDPKVRQDAERIASEVESDPEDDGEGCLPPPTPRTFTTFADITIARAGTRWAVGPHAASEPDELRFTNRMAKGGYSWWAVTPADVDYWHTHVSQGRALAFEFLDFVNNPKRNENYDARILPYIAKDMAKAMQVDYQQDGIASGFWNVIGEYLTGGTANR